MKYYCEKCKKLHEDNEMCPYVKKELKQHPEWLKEATDFAVVVGEERLIKTQALDQVAGKVNKVIGSNLSYEGTQQYVRDISVFKRLNEEAFSRSGHFSSPELAKSYLENVQNVAETTPRVMTSFESKLTGYGQEVDWIRMKQGELSSLFEKSSLLENNAAGVDGVTISRFNGKEISRTTIKASKNPITSNNTGINGVKKAIEKGNATEKDILFAPKGTEEAAKKAGLTNPVIEKNTAENIQRSNERLQKKILGGQAVTEPTMRQVAGKMMQGAVIGAVLSVTISSITTYIRYKNGELSKKEAVSIVAEDTLKGSLVGGAMGAVTIFLPAGPIGFVAGVAVGIYFDTLCKNILDEIWGTGAYGEILNASGYVYGMTMNLGDYYEKINFNSKMTERNLRKGSAIQGEIEKNFDTFEKMKGELL